MLLLIDFHERYVLLWLLTISNVAITVNQHQQFLVLVLLVSIAVVKRQTLHEIVGLVVSLEVHILQLALRDPKWCNNIQQNKTKNKEKKKKRKTTKTKRKNL